MMIMTKSVSRSDKEAKLSAAQHSSAQLSAGRRAGLQGGPHTCTRSPEPGRPGPRPPRDRPAAPRPPRCPPCAIDRAKVPGLRREP